MESYRMVLPQHLNHFGKLMGGHLLHWVDEVAWCAARMEFPGSDFVTAGMDGVAFHRGVDPGAVLRFAVHRQARGTTSVTYAVAVDRVDLVEPEQIFTTTLSLVCVDAAGAKRPLPES